MAFTSIAALAAGEAATTTLVLSAVAEVGTAMTLVGAVTGSKDLMKIGGAMGLVGGLGGMALGASSGVAAGGSVGGAEAGMSPEMLAADASMGGPAATADMASGASSAVDGAVGGADLAQVPTGAESGLGPDLASGADASMGGPAVPGTGDGGIVSQAVDGASPAAAGAVETPADAAVGVDTPAGAVGAAAPATPMSAADASMGGPASAPGGIVAPNAAPGQYGVGAPVKSTSFFNSIMGTLQDPKNRMPLLVGSKLVGGALQGMQQQSQFNEKLDLENRRLAQTSYGSQVGQNKPRGGIISGARR